MKPTKDYEKLWNILLDSYNQSAKGKGKERHANNKPFEKQPIITIGELVGKGFNLGQAIKKIQESQRLEYAMARNELLGAIVYIASAILILDKNNG